jgi:hypothetical protein
LSFAGRIAGIASRLPLGFQGGFPRGPLSEFRIARLLLGLQAGLTSGSLGKLRGHLSIQQPGNIPSGTLSGQIQPAATAGIAVPGFSAQSGQVLIYA